MTPAEVLRKAAQVIRERGWCQGVTQADDGRVCAVGALRMACGVSARHVPSEPAYWQARSAANEVVDVCNDDGSFEGMVSFNDDDGRTAGEVIAVLEAAAARLEAKP